MTKKNGLTTIIKKFNSETLKLSWVYIIAITLITALIVQFYRGSTGKTAPASQSVSQLEQQIHTLSQKIETQNTVIEQLQKEIELLKNK